MLGFTWTINWYKLKINQKTYKLKQLIFFFIKKQKVYDKSLITKIINLFLIFYKIKALKYI